MKHWPTKPLGEVTTCLDSQRIPVKEDDRQKRLGSVPYYGANGQVGWIDEAIFNEPLLLVAEDGGHFGEPKRGVAYTIRGPSWINNHAHALRPDESQVRLDFLGYHFRHFDFQPYITGTTRAKLTQRDLMRVEVPVPPLAEQERIVKLLDEADGLRKLRAQADRRTADLIPALFHEMFGDPASNSNRWKIVPLKTMGKITTGNTPSRNNPEYFGNFIEWIKTDNIDGAKGIITTAAEGLSEKGAKIGRVVPSGTVLITCIAGSRDRLGDAALTERQVAVNQQINALTPNRDVDPHFLCQMVGTMKNVIQHRATGVMTGIINKSTLESIPAICPPLPLQKEFGQRVIEMRGLEAVQAASRRRLDELFQSTLHRAFDGEL